MKLSRIAVFRHGINDSVQSSLVGRLVLLEKHLHLKLVGRSQTLVQSGRMLHGAEILDWLQLDGAVGAVDADMAAGLRPARTHADRRRAARPLHDGERMRRRGFRIARRGLHDGIGAVGHSVVEDGHCPFDHMAREQIRRAARIGRGVFGILGVAVTVVQVGIDAEHLADHAVMRQLHNLVDRFVGTEHVADLERYAARLADVRHLAIASLAHAKGLVHVHGIAGKRKLRRNIDQFGVRHLHDDKVARNFVAQQLFAVQLRPLCVVLRFGFLHPHRLRGGIVHPPHDLVVVREPQERIELSARMVVDDAPQDHLRLAVADRLPLGTRWRGI